MTQAELHTKALEDELKQKQIQIKALLTITQAVNENVSAHGLFEMYRSFLSWDMDIEKMGLFFIMDDHWECVSSINFTPKNVDDIVRSIKPLKRQHSVDESDIDELQDFDVILPVYHKDVAIAYAIIGGLDPKKDIHNRTQFITTITNMIAVAIENKKLFHKQMLQQQYEKELEIANSVQQMLIPQKLPSKDHIKVSKIYMPHSDVGGDYLDVIRLTKNKYALCIGDVSGKGVAAAILMANFQANIRSTIRTHHELEDFIVELNESVYNITKGDKFITFFVAVIDTEAKKITYMNCGHYPPVLYADGECLELKQGTTLLGAFDELHELDKGVIEYKDEAFLMLFTDGLPDLMDDDGHYFNFEQMSDFIKRFYSFTPIEFNNLLLKRIASFKGGQTYPDDIAILTCKLK